MSAFPQLEVSENCLALFVSDVHLSPTLTHTTEAFLNFLQSCQGKTQALYILGDLFEYWAGDDDRFDDYHQTIIAQIKALADLGVQIFWIAGNRDFLIGRAFASDCGMTILPDPSIITLANQHVLISHGDAYCTDDLSYMQFRAMVRQDAWQTEFLKRSLAERKAIIENMRQQSMAGQKEKSMSIMDVHPQAIHDLFIQHKISGVIHGHTHRPAHHEYDVGYRFVLPDWELDGPSTQHRAGFLSINSYGAFQLQQITPDTN
jgi:UDP-2,3-diacylglucosamine hydrolase